jgi:hypothetical protein
VLGSSSVEGLLAVLLLLVVAVPMLALLGQGLRENATHDEAQE